MANGKFNWGDETGGDSWNNRKKTPKVSELVDILDVSDKEWHNVRLIGPTIMHKIHWITIKPKPDFKGKYPTIPKFCLEAHGPEGSKCPYCENFGDPDPMGFVNVIDRELAENAPRKSKPKTKSETKLKTIQGYEGYWKEGKGGAWTPMRVLQINGSLGKMVQDTVALNRVVNKKTGTKKAYPPDHEKFGYDIQVKYDESKAFANRWSVNKDERNALTEEEKDYLLWKIPNPEVESEKEAEKQCLDVMKKAVNRGDGEPRFPELWEGDGKSSSKKGKKNKYADKFDEDEDMEEEDNKKKKAKSRRRDDDDDDEDEDDEPPRKSKSRKVFEEEEDDDDDEDDRPSRSKSKSKSKSRSRDDDDDEDEDDEPPRRTKKTKLKMKSKSKSRRRDDDDDDDEPPRKKKRSRDDDDDEDIPF